MNTDKTTTIRNINVALTFESDGTSSCILSSGECASSLQVAEETGELDGDTETVLVGPRALKEIRTWAEDNGM